MWRRLHKKEAYEYHRHNFATAPMSSAPAYSASHMEESHPFLSLTNNNTNNVTSIPRTNVSAARQFNESPNFQRLTVAQSSTNSNHLLHHANTNSLNRPRYSGAATSSNMRMNAQTLKMNHTRMNNISNGNEYNSINHDSNLLLGPANYHNPHQQNGNAFPSAPPPSQSVLPPPPPSLNGISFTKPC